jgi:hypothetical protein
MRFDLSDEEWALLEPLLPKNRKSARVDDRRILNASAIERLGTITSHPILGGLHHQYCRI